MVTYKHLCDHNFVTKCIEYSLLFIIQALIKKLDTCFESCFNKFFVITFYKDKIMFITTKIYDMFLYAFMLFSKNKFENYRHRK